MSETGELPLEEGGKAKKPQEFKTHEVMKMIDVKWGDRGEHIVLFDCPDVVGMHQKRRADVIAISMWQKSNYLINGAEIKVSRGDWLRELKDTNKSDPFMQHVDRWWLITGNIGVAKAEEIPEYWGWMNATATGLRVMRPAKVIESAHNKVVMDRKWAYGLIQRAYRASADEREREVQSRVTDILMSERARLEREFEGKTRDGYERPFKDLLAKVEDFRKASGLELDSWRWGSPTDVGKLAKALYELGLEGGFNSGAKRLRGHLQGFTELMKRTQAVLDLLENDNA